MMHRFRVRIFARAVRGAFVVYREEEKRVRRGEGGGEDERGPGGSKKMGKSKPGGWRAQRSRRELFPAIYFSSYQRHAYRGRLDAFLKSKVTIPSVERACNVNQKFIRVIALPAIYISRERYKIRDEESFV